MVFFKRSKTRFQGPVQRGKSIGAFRAKGITRESFPSKLKRAPSKSVLGISKLIEAREKRIEGTMTRSQFPNGRRPTGLDLNKSKIRKGIRKARRRVSIRTAPRVSRPARRGPSIIRDFARSLPI